MTDRQRDNTVSKEVSEIRSWMAGHQATCGERYEAIIRALKDCRAGISDLEAELKASKQSLREEMKSSDAKLETQVKKNQSSITSINLKIAYFLGAGAVGSFFGAAFFQLLSGALTK